MRGQVVGPAGEHHTGLAVVVEQQAQHRRRPGVAMERELAQGHVERARRLAVPGAGRQGPANRVHGDTMTPPFG
jgi:hypothetical protein